MKGLFILAAIGLFFAPSAFADFFDSHDQLFRNQSLCDAGLSDQVQAEKNFKRMFEVIRTDEEQGKNSIIEVEDYLAYSTRLKNELTGEECSILLHEDCYSAYCE